MKVEVKFDKKTKKYTFILDNVEFSFVYVPAGFYLQGDVFGNGLYDEKPVHEEFVEEFWMLETPCTQDLWEAVMKNNPSHYKNDPKLPVEQVSYYDVQKFIDEINKIIEPYIKRKISLPTESEWEYAARQCGQKVLYGNGQNEPVGFNAQLPFGEVPNKTTNVFSYKPNSLGLYDMSGNVWEWCLDEYLPYEEKIKREEYVKRLAKARAKYPKMYADFLKNPYNEKK